MVVSSVKDLFGGWLRVAGVACTVLIGSFSSTASGGNVPDGYTSLAEEGLVLDGMQWVHTGYIPSCTDRLEMTFEIMRESDTYQTLWCARSENETGAITAFLNADGKGVFDRLSKDNRVTSRFALGIGTNYVVKADYGTRSVTCNDKTFADLLSNDVFQAGSPLVLFAAHTGGMTLDLETAMTLGARYRFHCFRAYDAEGVLLREFIPVSDTAARSCLFETVHGTLYPFISFDDGTSSPVAIYDVLQPDTDYLFRFALQDGATLDLNAFSGPYCTFGKYRTVESETETVMFAAGAAVTVDVSGRTPAVGSCLIRWNTQPTATFSFDAETALRGIGPVVTASGLYYGGDAESTYPDKAVWTGAAGNGDLGDPANWSCSNLMGQAVSGATPQPATDVVITGETALNVPQGTTLPCARVLFNNWTLTANCDLRGLDFARCGGTRIELNDYELSVTGLGGALTVTNAPRYEILDSLVVQAGAWIDTGYTPTATDVVEMKVRFSSLESAYQCLYCSRTKESGATVRTYTCFVDGKKFRFDRYKFNTKPTNLAVIILETDYELIVNKKRADGYFGMSVNGTQAHSIQSNFNGDFIPGSPFGLFASHTTAPGKDVANPFGGTFYFFRVYRANGTLVREYLPARRKDGTVGIFETTQGVFLTNGGTAGGFTAGSTVTGLRGDGVLRVTVPEDETCENHATSLQGCFTLVKDGAGELVAYRQNQLYNGGTVIAGGSARARTALPALLTYNASQFYWGASNSVLRIDQDAVFDVAGQYAYRVYRVVLNGGTLSNSGPRQSNADWGGLGTVVLTADSEINVMKTLKIFSLGHSVDLGGHTLTVQIAQDEEFRIAGAVENGTINVTSSGSGGWIRPAGASFNYSSIVTFPTVDVHLSGKTALWIQDEFRVRDFSMDGTPGANKSKGRYRVGVYGRCTPVGVSDAFYGCRLYDGAVLDLSRLEGVLQAHSPNVECLEGYEENVGTSDSMAYESGATVTVHLGDAASSKKGCLVQWDTADTQDTVPKNVTFVLDEESAEKVKGSFEVREDGLYIVQNFILLIR